MISEEKKSCILAVVVHVYYMDVFDVIVHSLKGLNVSIEIYVTTIAEHESEVKTILDLSGLEFHVLVVNNRGRDVLPFLTIMPVVIEKGHVAVLKLHTKKTIHREDGDVWMSEMLNKLVNQEVAARCFKLIQNDSNIGMIAPAGHLVKMSKYFGANKKSVTHIAKTLGVNKSDLDKQVFVAGTMFYARISAIRPILDMAFSDDDFEIESLQKDGTLAHAIERCFSISCYSAGYKLFTSDGMNGNELGSVKGGYAYAAETGYDDGASMAEVSFFYLSKIKFFFVKLKNMVSSK